MVCCSFGHLHRCCLSERQWRRRGRHMSERRLIGHHHRKEHLSFSCDSPLTLSFHWVDLGKTVWQSHSEEAVKASGSISLVIRHLNGTKTGTGHYLVVTQQPLQDGLRSRSLQMSAVLSSHFNFPSSRHFFYTRFHSFYSPFLSSPLLSSVISFFTFFFPSPHLLLLASISFAFLSSLIWIGFFTFIFILSFAFFFLPCFISLSLSGPALLVVPLSRFVLLRKIPGCCVSSAKSHEAVDSGRLIAALLCDWDWRLERARLSSSALLLYSRIIQTLLKQMAVWLPSGCSNLSPPRAPRLCIVFQLNRDLEVARCYPSQSS